MCIFCNDGDVVITIDSAAASACEGARAFQSDKLAGWTEDTLIGAELEIFDDVYVSVAEVVCGMEGCPPLETVLTALLDEGGHVAFKLASALMDVTKEDVVAGAVAAVAALRRAQEGGGAAGAESGVGDHHASSITVKLR